MRRLFQLLWGPRRLHADDMQLILRSIDNMTAALDRLTASIGTLTAEDDKLLGILTTLSTEIRNNVGDDDALNALADHVDAEVAKVQGGETAGQPAPTPTPAPTPADTTDAVDANGPSDPPADTTGQ